MLAQSCLLRRPCQHLLSPTLPWHRQPFHTTPPHHTETPLPDHYATLSLPPTASASEIKKSFYALSKAHHPDLHPSDPSAPKKFVAISEAYNTLSTPAKKQSYDRDFLRATQQPQTTPPSGSHSSSGPGGRPASGLSRRRTQFSGPPPSFYRSGGWGAQSEKRSQHAEQTASKSEQPRTHPAGTGPGGFTGGFDNDVPHFDQAGHYQTQEKVQQGRHRARRRVERTMEDLDEYGGSSSPLFNFVLVSGALGVIYGVSGIVMGGEGRRQAREAAKE